MVVRGWEKERRENQEDGIIENVLHLLDSQVGDRAGHMLG